MTAMTLNKKILLQRREDNNGYGGGYTVISEKNVYASVYIPETDTYEQQYMYIPDIQPAIYRYNKAIGKLQYNPIRIAFIGY